ncbi:MAG: hypothetical protein LUC83_04360 [Clostridiales bacterium]|nr:hypothetical protein [Clostridiales bacterium]
MSKYIAPEAKVVSFDNDYVMAANQNKSGGSSCEYTDSTSISSLHPARPIVRFVIFCR